MDIKNLLHDVKKFKNKIALYDKNTIITFEKLEEEVLLFYSNIQLALRDSNLRFGTVFKNRVEYPLAYLMAFSYGMTIVPINIKLSKNEIEYIARDSQISLLLYDNDSYELVNSLDLTCKKINIDEFSQDIAPIECNVEVKPSTVTSINYTSGTTGFPKGVMLTNKNHYISCENFIKSMNEFQSTENILHLLPFSHSTVSLLLPGIKSGISSGVANCSTTLEMIEQIILFKPDMTLLYSQLIMEIVDLVKTKPALAKGLKSLKTVIYGSSQIKTEKLIDSVKILGSIFIQAYGMTETLPPLTILSKEDHIKALTDNKKYLNSCGQIIKDVYIKIVDENGIQLKDGQIGEVCCLGENVMMGYLNMQDDTKRFIQNGWAHTGDIGYIEDNYLFLLGRNKGVIKNNGKSIYCIEVEMMLQKIEGVKACTIFDMKQDNESCFLKIALVFNKKGNALDLKKIDQIIMNKLYGINNIKINYSVLEELPVNSNGKIDINKLKNNRLNTYLI